MTLTSRSRLLIQFTVLAALTIGIVMLALSSAGSNTVGAQQGTVPSKPTGVAVTETHDSVSLTWEDPADSTITHYQIFRRDRDVHDAGEFVTIKDDTGSAAASYTDNTVEPETRYLYRVKAVNAHGASHWSDYRRANTPAAPTPEPTPEPTPAPTPEPTPEPNTPATGALTISGTAQVGETLTADITGIADANGLDDAVFSYQWTRNDVSGDADISGAKDSTYTLVEADNDKNIKVRVGFTDDAGNEETLTSSATTEVTAAAMEPGPLTGFTVVDASDQTVVGALTVGATLTLEDPASGSYGIRVDTDPDVEIGSVRLELTGAKTVSQTENYAPYSLYGDDADGLHGEGMPAGAYTLRATAYSEKSLSGDDLGALEVSFTVADSSSDPQDTPENTPTTGVPAISGTVQVGETLTADTSGIADADGMGNAVFEYQWLADDTEVAGATSSTYTPVDADVGKTIKVRVTFTDEGGNPESLTSTATAPVDSAADETGPPGPIWSATLTVGRVGDNYGYQSFLNPQVGSLVPATFVLDDVTYTVGHIETAADYLTAFGVDRELPVGFTLELDGAQFESSDASLTSTTHSHIYTWLGRGMDWDVGEEVTALVVASPTFTFVVLLDPDLAPGNLKARGAGEKVTLTWDAPAKDAGSVTGYQILRGRGDGDLATLVADTQSTGTDYSDSDVSEKLTEYRYQVKALRGGDASQGSNVAEVLVALAAQGDATSAPVITGTAQVGELLTADISNIGDPDGIADADFEYQWIADDGTTDSDIDGATESTYWPSAGDVGNTIKVKVSFQDDNDNAESVTSAATGAVAGPAVTAVPADWSLIPDGLGAGDQFRLLFLSSETRNATPTSIATYNTWIQDRVDAGHTDIQDYNETFRAVGCTAAVDARDYTGTTYTSDDKGVPIYWLNGDKAADEYEDFYDETWDEEASMRDESGNTVSAPGAVWTGCEHDGTERFDPTGSKALGKNMGVVHGMPNSDATNAGPLSSNPSIRKQSTLQFYGLSGVFSVSPPGEILYSAKMTVERFSAFGITRLGFFVGTPSVGSLEPGEFLYDGAAISVLTLFHEFSNTEDHVLLGLDSGLGDGRFILYLDGEPFLIEEAGEQGTSISITFEDHGISWSNNQEVEVRLTVNREPTVTISGNRDVGDTMTAVIDDPDGVPATGVTHQWVRVDGGAETNIPGATGPTYIVVEEDLGKFIKVRVGYTDNANFLEEVVSRAAFIGDHEFNLRLNGQTLSWNPIGSAFIPGGYDLSSYEVQRREIFNGLGRNNDTWCHISPQWCLFTAHWAGYTFKGWADLNLHSRVIEYDLRVRAVFKARNGEDRQYTNWSETLVHQYPERVGEAPANLWFELHNLTKAVDRDPPDDPLVINGVYVCFAWFEYFVKIGPKPNDEHEAACSTEYDEGLAEATAGTPAPPKPQPCGDCNAQVRIAWEKPATPSGETLTGYRLESRAVNPVGPYFGGFQDEAGPDYLGTQTHYWERTYLNLTERDEDDYVVVIETREFNPGHVLFTSNQSFEYRIVAVYASGKWSPWSEVLHVTPPPGCATHSGTCSGPNLDFDTLVAARNHHARGIWSDGETMWVGDWDDEKLYAYDLFDKDRDAGKDIPLSGGNYPPSSYGIWSDGETMWVVNQDSLELMLYAYNLTPGGSFGSRDSAKDITLTNENANPSGLWSDGQTAWVLDRSDKKIYAYDLTPGSTFGDRDSGQDIALHSDNGTPRAIWSNGNTMWVTDTDDGKLYAYKLRPSANFGDRDPGKDIALKEENASPHGIWSNGKSIMWVADASADKIFAYRVPPSFFEKAVWSATMTVGSSAFTSFAFGWNSDDAGFIDDALTDADFVYDHETYELLSISFNTDSGELTIVFDATNSGSISNEGVRSSMALHVDGTALFLGKAKYTLLGNGRPRLVWEDAGLNWSAGDTVQLEMGVSE